MGFTADIYRKIILFLIILFISFYVFFPGRVYSIEWMAGAFTILIIILSGIRSLSEKWNNLDEGKYTLKLFWSSFIIRMLAMLILLTISYKTWNMFYVVGARDEMVYFRVSVEAMEIFKDTSFREAYNHIVTSFNQDISDTGFSTFLMFPVLLFGVSPVIIKIFLVFIGSIVVVRGYVLASMVFEKPVARLAGIFLALYPISWFYSSIMLKENIMVFLMIEAMIAIIRTQRSFTITHFIKALIFIILVFFFRPATSILLLLVFGFSFMMQYRIKDVILNVFLAVLVIGIYIYFLKSTGKYDEYYTQYTNINEFSQERLSFVESVNPFVAMVSSPVFAALSFVAPFPSIVTIPNAGGLPHTEYYYHVAGNLMWIVLAFFSVYGLFYAIRYERIKMAALIAFIIGYQFVLLKAMMFSSVRFSYPAKPFLLIMAAYGIYTLHKRKYYPVYLIASFIMIIGWNYIRLRGKG